MPKIARRAKAKTPAKPSGKGLPQRSGARRAAAGQRGKPSANGWVKATETRPLPGEPFADRVARFRDDVIGRKLDAFLVQSPHDQYWLTGFSGEDGAVLVTPRDVVLITDGRFDEAAQREAPWARKIIRQKRGPESIAEVIKAEKVRRVGFDPQDFSVHALGGITSQAKTVKFESASGIISTMRQCKDSTEIAYTLSAVRVAQKAFLKVLDLIKVGMREREIAATLDFVMRDLGADGSAFETIVAIGPNASLPHHRPGDKRVEMGLPILIDWGARVRGYVSDLTRVVWVGSIPDQLARAHRIVREAHDKAIAAVKPGVSAGALDKIARSHIKKAGLEKQFNHSLGHGIGLQIHEGPGLRNKAQDKLKAGMVITIEPGVYFPGLGGVRLEDDVLVTAKGGEVLSASLPLDFRIGGA